MKGKNIFIVQTDFLCEGDDCSYGIQAYQEKEDAQKYFNELVTKEKEDIKDKEDWVIDEDSDTLFEAYEDGYYSDNHSVISLKTIKIQ
jgi:hypothetical protein